MRRPTPLLPLRTGPCRWRTPGWIAAAAVALLVGCGETPAGGPAPGDPTPQVGMRVPQAVTPMMAQPEKSEPSPPQPMGADGGSALVPAHAASPPTDGAAPPPAKPGVDAGLTSRDGAPPPLDTVVPPKVSDAAAPSDGPAPPNTPASPAGRYVARIAQSSPVHYSRPIPGACRYEATLEDLVSTLDLDASGTVTGARATFVIDEIVLNTRCGTVPPFGRRAQIFSLRAASAGAGDALRIEYAPDASNVPEGSLVFEGRRTASAVTGTLTWKRTDRTDQLAFTLTVSLDHVR